MKSAIVSEGNVKIKILEGNVVKKDPVFFNPRMKFNRDVSVECLKRFSAIRGDPGISLLDLLSGSGIRGIRYLLEVPKVELSVMNDANPTAVATIKDNVSLNKVGERSAVERMGANLILALNENKFDFIDIDPFGSPADFMDGVSRAVRNNGALGVTATDLGPMAGTYPRTCLRRYGARPLKTDIMHETGVRILVAFVIRSLARQDKAFVPLLCFADMHYYRIFGRVVKKRSECDRILKSVGYLLYCPKCGHRSFSASNCGKCECGADVDFVGPLYTGKLFDEEFVSGISPSDDVLRKFFDAVKAEASISDEMLFDIHYVARKHGVATVKSDLVVQELLAHGFKACRSVYSGQHVRTDARVMDVVSAMSNIAKKK